MQFNKKCYSFQKAIVDIFNKEQSIPFLLKYYLFKDIWEKIEQNKFLIDRDVCSDQVKQETVSVSVPVPNEFFQENNSKEEK